MAFCRQTPNKLARQLPGLQPVLAALLVLSIFAGQDAPLRGQTAAESLDETAIAELHVGTTDEACDVCSPEAAQFDQWETLVDEDSRMRWEADLVLKKICGRIADERPDIPLFTLHDSVITTEKHVGYVRSVMSHVLEEWMGASPALKIESWA